MNEVLRKPSIAVASWAALVIGWFAWSGDLGVAAHAAAKANGAVASTREGPVIVRRNAETRLPRSERRGFVYDSLGFLVVGAEIKPADGEAMRTDPDGAFAVTLVEQRASDLLFTATGRRPAWLRTSAVAPDPMIVCLEPAAPWDVAPPQPTPAPALRGEGDVVGPDGMPLKNAFVNVLGTECWGRTDEVGRVELPLPMTSLTLVVHAPASTSYAGGYAARSAPFSSARDHGIVPLPRLEAQRAGSIRGTIRDMGGAPVAGLPVEVRSASTKRRVTTGAGGAFVLDGLLPDEYVVEPFAHRGQIGEPASIRVDRAVVSCDLQLVDAREVSLLVVDEQGAAAPGVWVTSSFNGVRRGVGQADGDGRVRLPLSASTSFEVRTAGDYAACAVQSFEREADQPTLVISQP